MECTRRWGKLSVPLAFCVLINIVILNGPVKAQQPPQPTQLPQQQSQLNPWQQQQLLQQQLQLRQKQLQLEQQRRLQEQQKRQQQLQLEQQRRIQEQQQQRQKQWAQQQQLRQQALLRQQQQRQQQQRHVVRVGNAYYDYKQYINYYCRSMFVYYYREYFPRPKPAQTDATCPTPTTPPPPSRSTADFRIPLDLYPVHYTVELGTSINLSNNTIDGFVRIEMKCRKSTNKVYLHMKSIDIDLQSIEFTSDSDPSAPSFMNFTMDADRDFGIFHLSDVLREGENYSIAMNFTTSLSRDMTGLYEVNYRDDMGQDTNKSMVVSHLAPTFARTIFPCFDEPSIRATFDFTTVTGNPEYKQYTTGDLVKSQQGCATFERTPPVSTYQLGFQQHDMNETHLQLGGVLIQTATRSGQTPYFNTGPVSMIDNLLPLLVTYFNVDYPLKFYAAAATPEAVVDVSDSWGAVTYRESALRYKSVFSTSFRYKSAALLVSQALSQQWINIVSPAWWDDWWLQKGLRSYMGYVGANLLDESLNVIDHFVADTLHTAFIKDELRSSNPVYVPEFSPEEFNLYYSILSCKKGASLIRMMNFFLGEDVFQKGLKRYLTDFRFQAATHSDLWNAMQQEADGAGLTLNVSRIMDTYVSQRNFPVLNVQRVTEGLLLTQERFVLNTNALDSDSFHSNYNYTWDIPVTFTHRDAVNFNQTMSDITWFPRDQESLLISTALPDVSIQSPWFIVNVKQYGYYRVNYEPSQWDAIIDQLTTNHTVICSTNRAQLISDLWHLVRADKADLSKAMKLMTYLKEETRYAPWLAATREFDFVGRMMSRSDGYPKYQNWTRTILKAAFENFGKNTTTSTHEEKMVNSLINKYACAYGVEECVSWANELFTEWKSSRPIEPDWRENVYCTAVSGGGHLEWSQVHNAFRAEDLEEEANRLLRGLFCTRDTWYFRRLMQYTIESENGFPNPQQIVELVVSASESSIGACTAWDFFTANVKRIEKRVGALSFAMETMIEALTASFNTEEDLYKLKNFMSSTHVSGSVSSVLQRTFEKTQANIKWLKANTGALNSYLTV